MTRLSRLLSDYILVQLEPEQERTAGGIVTLSPEPVRTGHVLMVGPGRDYIDKFVPMPEGLTGKRVAFMIAASQTKKGQAVRRQLSLDDDQEIIRLGDILFELDEGVRVSK